MSLARESVVGLLVADAALGRVRAPALLWPFGALLESFDSDDEGTASSEPTPPPAPQPSQLFERSASVQLRSSVGHQRLSAPPVAHSSSAVRSDAMDLDFILGSAEVTPVTRPQPLEARPREVEPWIQRTISLSSINDPTLAPPASPMSTIGSSSRRHSMLPMDVDPYPHPVSSKRSVGLETPSRNCFPPDDPSLYGFSDSSLYSMGSPASPTRYTDPGSRSYQRPTSATREPGLHDPAVVRPPTASPPPRSAARPSAYRFAPPVRRKSTFGTSSLEATWAAEAGRRNAEARSEGSRRSVTGAQNGFSRFLEGALLT